MTYDPNKTDRWSVRDIREAERQEQKRRLKEVLWACVGIVAMIAAVIAFLLVVG